VAGPGRTPTSLFLCSLCICEHHCSRNRDVYAFLDCDSCGWRTGISGSAVVGLLFELRSIVNALWDDSSPNLFWRWLYFAANLVVDWLTGVVSDYCYFECCWVYL